MRTGRAAVVIDDMPAPRQPRGIEIRGQAEAVDQPVSLTRIHPERIVSWGIVSDVLGVAHGHTVR